MFKPHDYQRTAIDFLEDRLQFDNELGAGLFLDPGLGKTSITLAYLERVQAKRVLVIAPLRPVYSVWPNEVQKWGFQFQTNIVHGPVNDRRQALLNDGLHLINPEGLKWLFAQPNLPTWDHLIIDESTKFKSWAKKRPKLLRKNLHRFPKRIILTGTPAPHSYADLPSQIYCIDDGEALGKTIGVFRARYCRQGGFHNRQWLFMPLHARAVEDAIGPLVLRMDCRDHLDMPELVFNDVWVDLPPTILKAYRKFERELFAALESGVNLTAASAGGLYMSCRGIANGGIYSHELGQQRKAEFVHDTKVKAVVDLIEELGGKPVVVAYQFHHDLDRLRRIYPHAPAINGKTPAKVAEATLKRWNDGTIDVLFVQPQSLSHGVNMQGVAHDLIWLGLTDSLETYLQLNARLWRQGVREQVRIHHVVAKSTVDVPILERTREKEGNQRSLLDALKAYRGSPRKLRSA